MFRKSFERIQWEIGTGQMGIFRISSWRDSVTFCQSKDYQIDRCQIKKIQIHHVWKLWIQIQKNIMSETDGIQKICVLWNTRVASFCYIFWILTNSGNWQSATRIRYKQRQSLNYHKMALKFNSWKYSTGVILWNSRVISNVVISWFK